MRDKGCGEWKDSRMIPRFLAEQLVAESLTAVVKRGRKSG